MQNEKQPIIVDESGMAKKQYKKRVSKRKKKADSKIISDSWNDLSGIMIMGEADRMRYISLFVIVFILFVAIFRTAPDGSGF